MIEQILPILAALVLPGIILSHHTTQPNNEKSARICSGTLAHSCVSLISCVHCATRFSGPLAVSGRDRRAYQRSLGGRLSLAPGRTSSCHRACAGSQPCPPLARTCLASLSGPSPRPPPLGKPRACARNKPCRPPACICLAPLSGNFTRPSPGTDPAGLCGSLPRPPPAPPDSAHARSTCMFQNSANILCRFTSHPTWISPRSSGPMKNFLRRMKGFISESDARWCPHQAAACFNFLLQGSHGRLPPGDPPSRRPTRSNAPPMMYTADDLAAAEAAGRASRRAARAPPRVTPPRTPSPAGTASRAHSPTGTIRHARLGSNPPPPPPGGPWPPGPPPPPP